MSRILEDKFAMSGSSDWQSAIDWPLERLSTLDANQLTKQFNTSSRNGLAKDEASRRLQIIGENTHQKMGRINPWRVFLHQFQSSVVFLLMAAAIASMFFREVLQAAGIMAAVLINAITGFYMEYKAGVSLAGLKALAGLTVRTLRQGEQLELSVNQLVPGDVVILEAGARVPADIALIEAASLSIDESPLTGESAPVFKDLHAHGTELSNIVFHGTLVTGGRGKGIVLKTGGRSSLGKLGKLLEQTEVGSTPLENQLEDLGKQMSILTVIVCVIVSIVGILHHENIVLMVETGIALAVAAIPEGLPVLATLALAVGTQRMVANRAILRHLAAVETLGCTSVICTDKTGTLTENKMTASKLYANGRLVEIEGSGYEPQGKFIEGDKTFDPQHDPVLQALMVAGALCNDALLEEGDETEGWHVHGDPTEGALLTLAEKAGLRVSTLNKEQPRISEFTFDLNRKRMTTIHQMPFGAIHCYTKGSPGAMFDLCSKILTDTGERELDACTKEQFRALNKTFAEEGLRVLAVAQKSFSSRPVCLDMTAIESEMTLIGIVGIKDPVKPGVKEAICACKNAGIRVIMLTGDQAATAKSIAEELGIIGENRAEKAILTGKELIELNSEQTHNVINSASVLARVTPELKLDIVKKLQQAYGVISMTGDGVNDAPALKQANIGVAMGQKGTDLARSASQMVITDDNFATIVKAIEQGRIIYINIQRAVGYLLTASLSSVITVALGIMFNIGLPLSPLQLLWLNLIMHIFPGLGIVLQKGDKSVMNDEPRDPTRKLISWPQYAQIVGRSIIVSIAVLFAVWQAETVSLNTEHTTTIGLCTLSLCLLLQAWSWLGVHENRALKGRFAIKIGPAMFINMAIAYMLLFAALYLPILSQVLSTRPIGMQEFFFCVIISFGSFLVTYCLQFAIKFLKKA